MEARKAIFVLSVSMVVFGIIFGLSIGYVLLT